VHPQKPRLTFPALCPLRFAYHSAAREPRRLFATTFSLLYSSIW
jgi:hypothetical protein